MYVTIAVWIHIKFITEHFIFRLLMNFLFSTQLSITKVSTKFAHLIIVQQTVLCEMIVIDAIQVKKVNTV